MPILTIQQGVRTGLRVQVRVTVGRAELFALRAAGRPLPPPVLVTAPIDTGVERSCIDPAVATRAALPVFAFGLAATSGASFPFVPALGGSTANTIHQAGFAVLHPVRNSDLVVPELIVGTLPLRAFGIEAVIGRDVLASCVLVYDGPSASATLAY